MCGYIVLAVGLVAMGAFGAARLGAGSHAKARAFAATASPTASATVQPPASDTPLTLAVLGASDAFGVGTANPQMESWPVLLAQQLSTKTHLIDLGIPGATVELAARDEVPVALAAQPDVVTILLGINDLDDGVSLASFDGQLRDVVRTLKNNTSATIYISNLPDLTLLPYFAKDDPLALSVEVTNWNADISAICADMGVNLVDLFAAWNELAQHPEYISADGLHPSATGAARIAAAFYATIDGVLP